VSGIYGILSRDGCPVSGSQLYSMADALSHRGKVDVSQWKNENVGLGELSLDTAEGFSGRALGNSVSDLIVIADARLDNRDELIAALRPFDCDRERVTDNQLIRAAYDRWHEECVGKLLGDFAFAVWDSRNKNLFVARDRFGVKPLFYHLSDRFFVFASEIKALFFLPQLQSRLNEQMIADHLTGAYSDSEMTFYRDVIRMQPAHTLKVSVTGFKKACYWRLDPERSLRMRSDDEYAQAFREKFTEAVRCRVIGNSNVGGMLSGGLDSTSIAAVAQDLLRKTKRFPTFSLVFDAVPECDERTFINAAIDKCGFDSHFVRGDSNGPLSNLERIVLYNDSPVFGPNLFLHWALYSEVERSGVGVILDGFDGDSVVSQGYQYLNELASQKRWMRLGRESIALSRAQGTSPWPNLLQYVQHFGFKPVIERWKPLRGARRIFRGLIRRKSGNLAGTRNAQWHELLAPDFVHRNHVEDRYRSWRRNLPQAERTERAAHLKMVTQPTIPMALEIYDHMAAAFSIEPRYPFWDSRLVEFCLSVPPEQKLHRGLGRTIMRRALADLLPREIHQRKEKTDFTPVFRHGLMSVDRPLMESVLEDTSDLECYVDGGAIRGLTRRLSENRKGTDATELVSVWRVLSLAVWLRAVSRRLKEVRTM